MFDIEGYDFILNKNTLFTEGNLVKHDFEKLKFILEKYLDLDPVLLESLHYQGMVKVETKKEIEDENGKKVEVIEEKEQKMMPL